MGICLAILISLLGLLCFPAHGAQSRQLCLSCHSVHYAKKGSCTGCHSGNPGSDRKDVAHDRLIRGKYAHYTLGNAVLKEGERLMENGACRRCHVSNRRGNRLAASLDSLKRSKTPEELAQAIRSPVLGMPEFRFSERQITALVNAILNGQGSANGPNKEMPLVIHLESGKKSRQDIFTTKCGGCHRVLSEHKGALGKSDNGPNLSGILSPHYPKTYKTNQAWTKDRLRHWLKNPRLTRPAGRMPPVVLSEKEFAELVDILTVKSVR